MSEEQERRINNLESKLEKSYNFQLSVSERIAVVESQMQNIAQSVRDAQEQTNAQIRAMNGDIKNSLTETQNSAHKRTTIFITVFLTFVTTAVQVALKLLQ